MSLVVDAHHHVWDLSVRDQSWIEGEGLAPIRRSFLAEDYDAVARSRGIDASVLVETINVAPETGELCAVAAASEVVAAVVGWADLTAPSIVEDLAALLSAPYGTWLRGIRHQVQGEPDPDWLLREDVRRGLRAVGEAGLLYEFVVLPTQLDTVHATVRDLPEVSFVLAHAGKPPLASGDLAAWRASVERLARLGNLTCKLSGLVTEADWSGWTADDLRPVADTLLAGFGPERLMLGSDWPVSLLGGSFAEVWDAYVGLLGHLTDGERAAVLGGTARYVYGI